MTTHDPKTIQHLHDELHSHLPPEPALRLKALETVLVEKGFLAEDAVDKWLDDYSENVGPMNGARVISRAWSDAGFADRLAADTPAAFSEVIPGIADGYPIVAVFNTPATHNLIVCTLCSCYPLGILGMSPSWYKSTEYRARAVRDPRGVLAEFGTVLPEGVELRVWDSTSDRRYMVVPERPAGTEGWSEEELAGLVTRNSMIGTVRDLSPARGAA